MILTILVTTLMPKVVVIVSG